MVFRSLRSSPLFPFLPPPPPSPPFCASYFPKENAYMYTDCSAWLWILSHIINHPSPLTSWIILSYVLTSISIKIIVCSFNLRDLCCTWWVKLRLQSLLGLIYICMCIFILQVGTNVHKEASSCCIWKVKHFQISVSQYLCVSHDSISESMV